MYKAWLAYKSICSVLFKKLSVLFQFKTILKIIDNL